MVGSSPRVWGQVKVTTRTVQVEGIIPTRVGTRYAISPFANNALDHPHACGDKESGEISEVGYIGSSPRVWGQVPAIIIIEAFQRIIPTRVGTRTTYVTAAILKQDHPHACGDKRPNPARLRCLIGSSPRVWGQGPFQTGFHTLTNIIPTRVGTR